jgi:hypothetical protein
MHSVRPARFCAALLISALLANQAAYCARKPLDPPAVKDKVAARGLGHGLRVVESDKTQVTGIVVAIGGHCG